MSRKRKKKGLPEHLFESNGRYRYHNPTVGIHWQKMGSDKVKACQAARQLNGMLQPQIEQLVDRALGRDARNISDIITLFKEEILPNKEMAKGSRDNLGYRLNRIKKDIGTQLVSSFDVEAAASYLDANFEGDSYKQHRSVLSQLFRLAMTKGWCKSDPVEATLSTRAAAKVKKKRERLTKEQFDAIYSVAEPWLQIAMKLGLMTLQRRGDLVSLKFSDIKEDRLFLIQQKTEKWGVSARLSIGMGPDLQELINRARNTGVLSPMIIHRKPHRIPSRDKQKKEHWSAVNPRYLTDAFNEARDKTELFEKMAKDRRPTFHEIRSLGGSLYKKAGWTTNQVQELMGHTSEDMTEDYLDGHEHWTYVEANLKI